MATLSEIAEAYLDGFDASGLVRERALYYVDIYSQIVPEGTFHSVFIDDGLDSEKQRTIESMWLYGDHFVAECSNFLVTGEEKWDFARLDQLDRWEIKSANFSPTDISYDSRLSVRWTSEGGIVGEMRAIGQNCANLLAIVQGVLIPAMERAQRGPRT